MSVTSLPAVPEPTRAAATLVLLRDASTDIEVLLLRRHTQSRELGGACVFPGGKLDPADTQLDAGEHLDRTHADLHQSLSESETSAPTAAGLYVAALREALEECGLLLAEPAAAGDGTAVDADAGRALLRSGLPFNALLAQQGLRLQTRHLVPWSRWITPVVPTVSSRRFDTRFFLAQAPHQQQATPDHFETTECLWLTPRAALEQYRSRQIDLVPPQIMSLAHLARYQRVASALQAARQTPPPLILPEVFDHDGPRIICCPGDPLHSVRQRALPGPTRLRYHQQRFLPEDGFDTLFA